LIIGYGGKTRFMASESGRNCLLEVFVARFACAKMRVKQDVFLGSDLFSNER
jgi:hypothetical protein